MDEIKRNLHDTQGNSLFPKLIITIAVVFGTVIASATSPLQQAYAGGSVGSSSSAIRADFNGDGMDDLAIGVPFEDIDGIEGAGAVNVIYGSPGRLTAAGNQVWSQLALAGEIESTDIFGSALTR